VVNGFLGDRKSLERQQPWRKLKVIDFQLFGGRKREGGSQGTKDGREQNLLGSGQGVKECL
jgi:hypothetical protein